MARRTKRSSGRKVVAKRNRSTGTKATSSTAGRRGTATQKAKPKTATAPRAKAAPARRKREQDTSTEPLTEEEGRRSAREIAISSLAQLDAASSAGDRAKRAADSMAGDEAPGGTVEVPDNDRVDDWAGAFGVERSPDSPVRASSEILDERDRRRGGRRPAPKL